MNKAPSASPDDESSTALGDWFATALFWKPQAALLVNTRTMIPVFTPLAPAGKLLDRAPEAIAAVLRAHGVPADAIAAELKEMSEVRIAPTNDRQIVGVMNEFVFQAEGAWGAYDPDLFSMSMRLSDLILGPLMNRHGTPADELAACFRDDADVITLPTTNKPVATPAGRRVHQLKMTLRGSTPPIWRRIVLDGGETLAHLHAVIQAAFGWWDCHLHDFDIDGVRYGIPDDDWTPVKDERRVNIDQAIGNGARKIRYLYDFGDNWDHDIVVEKTTSAGGVATVPDCIGGRRACPPEDCGGLWGYSELLDILADPTHPEHEERLEWAGGPIDPNAFDPADFADNLHQQTLASFNLFD